MGANERGGASVPRANSGCQQKGRSEEGSKNTTSDKMAESLERSPNWEVGTSTDDKSDLKGGEGMGK